jgi:L-iditol 2-dehydrogenase
MQAVVVRAPMQFDVEAVPVPEVPEGGLLLRVKACGLCGSDLRTLRMGHRKVTFPWTIGHEICGIVAEVGPAYQGRWQKGEFLAVGPLAYCGTCDFCVIGKPELCENYREIAQAWPGGFAELIAIPPECVARGTILPVPDGLDPAFAAVIEPISSCVHAQEKGQVGLGDTVVIIGSGPVGCTHLSLARARGASKVLIADMVADRLTLAEPFQPDATINVANTDLVAEVRRLTDGKGADVIVTATPAPIAIVQAVEMAKKGGRILLFGGLPKEQSKPGIDLNIVHYNALHLMGTTIFAPRHFLTALNLVAAAKIPVAKLVTHRFPLTDFKHGATMALEGKVLKAVFLP